MNNEDSEAWVSEVGRLWGLPLWAVRNDTGVTAGLGLSGLFFLSFANTEPSVLSYGYGNAYGLGYDLGIEPRVRGQWIFLQFAVFLVFLNSVATVQSKATLAVFGEKVLGRREDVAVKMRSCWKCFIFSKKFINSYIMVCRDLNAEKNPPKLHTNEWSLFKSQWIADSFKIFFLSLLYHFSQSQRCRCLRGML